MKVLGVNALPKYLLTKDGTLHLVSLGETRVGKRKLHNTNQETFLEGAEEIYKEKRRQKRNAELRAKAIESYGLSCYVCGFSFGDTYGDYGLGFIELHHLKLLADSEGERESTVNDVRVVCSNCHSVLHHQGRAPMNIDKLKAVLMARSSKQDRSLLGRKKTG